LERCIRPFLGSQEFTNGNARSCRWLRDASSTEFRVLPEIMKRIDDDHMPILHLEADELLSRYESLLKACYVKDIRLRVPTPISDAFHETRIEVERRGLSPQVKLPSILDPNDPDPIFHNGRSIVRYLDEPFLSQFFSGLISLP
jgi:hypothetical protein